MEGERGRDRAGGGGGDKEGERGEGCVAGARQKIRQIEIDCTCPRVLKMVAHARLHANMLAHMHVIRRG